jgi:hypothetical protein
MAKNKPWSKVGKVKKAEGVKLLESAFANDYDVVQACIYAKISRQTFYNWIRKDPDLLTYLLNFRNMPLMKAKKIVNDKLNSKHPDPEFALKFLKSRSKEYKNSAEIEVNNTSKNSKVIVKIPTN